MKTRIYTFDLDETFDQKFKKFEENLSEDEEVTTTATVGENKFMVFTKDNSKPIRNLLLEEVKKRGGKI